MMFNVSTDARRLEEENTRLRREVADLQDINRKLAAKLAADNARARAEVTRLKDRLTALAEDVHGTADNPSPGIATRIHRILAGIQ